jgi:hypothetical protein
MEKISWADRVKKKHQGEQERSAYYAMKKGQLDCSLLV